MEVAKTPETEESAESLAFWPLRIEAPIHREAEQTTSNFTPPAFGAGGEDVVGPSMHACRSTSKNDRGRRQARDATWEWCCVAEGVMTQGFDVASHGVDRFMNMGDLELVHFFGVRVLLLTRMVGC